MITWILLVLISNRLTIKFQQIQLSINSFFLIFWMFWFSFIIIGGIATTWWASLSLLFVWLLIFLFLMIVFRTYCSRCWWFYLFFLFCIFWFIFIILLCLPPYWFRFFINSRGLSTPFLIVPSLAKWIWWLISSRGIIYSSCFPHRLTTETHHRWSSTASTIFIRGLSCILLNT